MAMWLQTTSLCISARLLPAGWPQVSSRTQIGTATADKPPVTGPQCPVRGNSHVDNAYRTICCLCRNQSTASCLLLSITFLHQEF